MAEAIAALPPDLTVVLVAREQPPKRRAPKALADAVEKAGGQVLTYAAPKARELPGWLAPRLRGVGSSSSRTPRACSPSGSATGRRGSRPSSTGSRSGPSPGADVTAGDLEAMVADTSEEVAWALSDAIVDRDAGAALAAAERLADQGEAVTPLIYQAAKRLREANAALELLERGPLAEGGRVGAADAPYAAKQLMRRLRRPFARRDPRLGVRDRRPRVVDQGRLGLSGARRADARRAARRRPLSQAARGAGGSRAARAFLRAPELRCSAPLLTAVSIREQSSRCSASAAAASPDSTAASSRWKWVLTALVMRRFSSCSRSGARVALLL